MSMPTFPEDGTNLSRDQALNMLLGSIAMEELALSHIMNAEGEKLQYLLGTLPGAPCRCATTKELLEVNRSITALLEQAGQNQMLLKGKLAQVLEVLPCNEPYPPPPVTAPCVLTAANSCWKSGRRLLWQQACHCPAGCWDSESPAVFCPPQGHAVLLGYSLQLTAGTPGAATATLVRIRGGQREPVLTCDGCACAQSMSILLSGSTLLPATTTPQPDCYYWVLGRPCNARVQQATLWLLPL